ncbi:MAG: hypothetical protein ACRDY1_07480 [Acidimicrobiales bacterium]
MAEHGGTVGPGPDGADQWQVRVVDTIDDVVGAVQDRIVRPLLLVARAVVFGLIVAAMTLVLSITVAVVVIRVLDVYAFRNRVWAADVTVGGVFAVGGLVLWALRRPRGKAGAA